MAEEHSAGLTAAGEPRAYGTREGRRFALTLAAAFALIAAFGAWRENETVSSVAGGLAALLIAAGIAVPARLGPVEALWMRLAHAISRVTTPIILGIIYFLVLTPAGVLRRTFGRNPLVHAPGEGGYWQERKARSAEERRARMERQF